MSDDFFSEGYLYGNPLDLQELSLAIYRLMATGGAVDLAAAADMAKVANAEDLLRLVPDSAYERDASGRLTGFIGLTLTPTRHWFLVADHALYTWCAFDALFLPQLLQMDATLRTTCPATDAEIAVGIAPDFSTKATPDAPVLSVVAPERAACRHDLRGAFCNNVNLFCNQSAFGGWANGRAGMSCISLAGACDLARKRNLARFPDLPL